MAVILETSIGDLTVDLYTDERPICCKNFLKLCKVKYYNFSLFHTVQRGFIAQTGDPTNTGRGGASVFEKLYGDQARYFEAETKPRIKHKKLGTLSMVNNGNDMHGSQFFITLAEDLDYLDGVHTVFGEVAEGFETIQKFNETIVDDDNRPYKDIRIYHTVVLDDPYEDPAGLAAFVPDRSPVPTKEMLDSGRIRVDEDIDDFEGKSQEEVEEMIKEREAKANAQILEMVGDLPEVDCAPPENVLFVCKLNPVTTAEDLEIIFSRFGNIVSCEVIKDQKSGESLQYAFIEFENPEQCEQAYFKMDNVLIDERRIHVDFSQSVSKIKWKGKGKGVEHFPDAKDDGRPVYHLKNRQRKDHYDLVLSDDEESTAPVKKKKKKYKKSSGSDSESDYDSKKKTRKRQRSRSPYDRKKERDRITNKSDKDYKKEYDKRDGDSDRRDRDSQRREREYDRRERDYDKKERDNSKKSRDYDKRDRAYDKRDRDYDRRDSEKQKDKYRDRS